MACFVTGRVVVVVVPGGVPVGKLPHTAVFGAEAQSPVLFPQSRGPDARPVIPFHLVAGRGLVFLVLLLFGIQQIQPVGPGQHVEPAPHCGGGVRKGFFAQRPVQIVAAHLGRALAGDGGGRQRRHAQPRQVQRLGGD